MLFFIYLRQEREIELTTKQDDMVIWSNFYFSTYTWGKTVTLCSSVNWNCNFEAFCFVISNGFFTSIFIQYLVGVEYGFVDILIPW